MPPNIKGVGWSSAKLKHMLGKTIQAVYGLWQKLKTEGNCSNQPGGVGAWAGRNLFGDDKLPIPPNREIIKIPGNHGSRENRLRFGQDILFTIAARDVGQD